MVDPTASWGWSRQVQRGTSDHINPISATRMRVVPAPIRNNPTSACMSHQSASTLFEIIAQGSYRVPEIVTRGRFPDGGESDSTWRTQEARHVGSDTIAPGSSCATASRFCHEDP